MCDDKTANTTADYNHIPLPSLAPSIPCPASDRCQVVVVTFPSIQTVTLDTLEHLKIETRLIDERFASVMGECVI